VVVVVAAAAAVAVVVYLMLWFCNGKSCYLNEICNFKWQVVVCFYCQKNLAMASLLSNKNNKYVNLFRKIVYILKNCHEFEVITREQTQRRECVLSATLPFCFTKQCCKYVLCYYKHGCVFCVWMKCFCSHRLELWDHQTVIRCYTNMQCVAHRSSKFQLSVWIAAEFQFRDPAKWNRLVIKRNKISCSASKHSCDLTLI
jgi:hypothetical protein